MTNGILALISMALSKTLDAIPHRLLLGKLKAYGVNSRSQLFAFQKRFTWKDDVGEST